MSEEEIRSRTVQELGTEIRRLVTLLEAIAIEPGVGRRFEEEEEPQPIVLPDLIAPEPEVQIAVVLQTGNCQKKKKNMMKHH
jgi:hypothetical protein